MRNLPERFASQHDNPTLAQPQRNLAKPPQCDVTRVTKSLRHPHPFVSVPNLDFRRCFAIAQGAPSVFRSGAPRPFSPVATQPLLAAPNSPTLLPWPHSQLKAAAPTAAWLPLNGAPWDRQSPDWRLAERHSGEWRSWAKSNLANTSVAVCRTKSPSPRNDLPTPRRLPRTPPKTIYAILRFP